MELQGKVILVMPIVSGTSKSGNAWQKQEFIIETTGQYPKKVCFQLFGDKVNEGPSIGDEVKVSFDPESREWNSKWFTQLNAWKIEKQGAQLPSPAPAQAPAPPTQTEDGLPF